MDHDGDAGRLFGRLLNSGHAAFCIGDFQEPGIKLKGDPLFDVLVDRGCIFQRAYRRELLANLLKRAANRDPVGGSEPCGGTTPAQSNSDGFRWGRQMSS